MRWRILVLAALFNLPLTTPVSAIIETIGENTTDDHTGNVLDVSLVEAPAFDEFNFATGPNLFAGFLDTSIIGRNHTLLNFDLTQLPAGAIFTVVTLNLEHDHPACGAGHTVDSVLSLRGILVANDGWVQGTKNGTTAGSGEPCWEAFAADGSGGITTAWAGDSGGDGGSDAGCSISNTDWDSTDLGLMVVTTTDTSKSISIPVSFIQGWYDTPSTNHGFMFGLAGSSGKRRVFFESSEGPDGKRPFLEVTYTIGAPSLRTVQTASGLRTIQTPHNTRTVQVDAP